MSATSLTDRLFDDADTGPIDPFSLFEDWYAEAKLSEPNDPHAMGLATVDEDGQPDVRMVLLNARDARGYCFFTNFESDKARQLLATPKAAFVMHWKSLRRQIRVRGPVEVVDLELSEGLIDLADRTVSLWIEKLRIYRDANQWPGYAQSPVVWDVPGWMRDDDEEGDS